MNTWTDKNVIRVFAPLSRNAAATSANVDLTNYDVTRGVKVVVDTQVTTAGAMGFKVQQSDTTTEADFADLDTSSFTAISDSTSAAAIQQFVVKPTKRYLRGYLTPVTTGAFVVAVTFIAEKRWS